MGITVINYQLSCENALREQTVTASLPTYHFAMFQLAEPVRARGMLVLHTRNYGSSVPQLYSKIGWARFAGVRHTIALTYSRPKTMFVKGGRRGTGDWKNILFRPTALAQKYLILILRRSPGGVPASVLRCGASHAIAWGSCWTLSSCNVCSPNFLLLMTAFFRNVHFSANKSMYWCAVF